MNRLQKILSNYFFVGLISIPYSWANSDAVTTESPFKKEASLTLSYVENMLALDKRMIISAKLVAVDKKYSRVEIQLTPEASKEIYKIKPSNKHQKLIFAVNNQIMDFVNIQKDINENGFFIVIGTSPKNADFIVKTLSK